jgi:hypothetical protein
MKSTKMASRMVKKKGRKGWMVLNPTIGTYQSRKMRQKRIRQVKTKSPMKVLFLGWISKNPSKTINVKKSWRNGITEHWNVGFIKSIFAFKHYSNIPLFQIDLSHISTLTFL